MLERIQQVILIEAGNTAWKAATGVVDDSNKLLSVELLFRSTELREMSDWLKGRSERKVVFATVGAEQEAVSLIADLQDFGFEVYRVQTSEIDGFQHCYKDISHLGVDRWLTMLALRHLNKPLLIIDVGTAITVDWMDAEGKHLGGWIAPGFALMQESLVRRSARLRIQDTAPESVIGQGTESAIGTGCSAALNGTCAQAIEYADQLFGAGQYQIYLTGGGVRHLHIDALPNPVSRPHLVLEGLYAWLKENLQK